MQVLIIDRSNFIMDRLEEIISEAGNVRLIHKAVSYDEAIDLIKENKPDAVVLDSGLPSNESVDLLKKIKKSMPDTRVIVLSIFVDSVTEKRYKSLGADFFFDKYHEFGKIPAIINGLSKNHKTRDVNADK